ncbi:hypothetical protein [Thiolapillus sp.]|uniref:hypothetical protein n=1 Tax=Thiolapillus sp. TaxID=2017437 RepID=UPI00263AED9A|nr:hypothetical protein [Thiolapillus sp.]
MRSCCVALGDQDGWGTNIGCQRPSRFWGLGCPKIYHEVEDTLVLFTRFPAKLDLAWFA